MNAVVRGLPRIETLSQHQQRGMDCVWCGITLTPATAVDLGPRPVKRLDYVTEWYPRACATHVGQVEYEELLAHCADCPTCLETGCEDGARLRRAAREARR
ncbi:hypothetical protein [Streptomyces sp. NPDC002994]|uniref:hypothetical protein n=1 Tax=Streptomyces sp. NPDC002994 TaxID=3154441 RepID=UPI0033A7FD53